MILGGVLSRDGSWLADEASLSGIPTFGITSSSNLLDGRKDSFFRICPGTDYQAKAVGAYYARQGCGSLLVVASTENDAYVDPLSQDPRRPLPRQDRASSFRRRPKSRERNKRSQG